MLCGCGAKDSLPPLKVDLPDTCERALVEVSLPDVKPTDDARLAFIKDDAALITANAVIRRGRGCVADMRKLYREGKP